MPDQTIKCPEIQKDKNNNITSFKDKLFLLILDKLFLALFIALAVHFFNVTLHTQDKTMEYQQIIFDRRLDSYIELLTKVTIVTDELALYWTYKEEQGWDKKLSELSDRWEKATNQSSGMGGGSWSSIAAIVPMLHEIELLLREKKIYFSEPILDATNEYLKTVHKDLEADMKIIEANTAARERGELEADDKLGGQDAWNRALRAYEVLEEKIRSKLKLDGIILG